MKRLRNLDLGDWIKRHDYRLLLVLVFAYQLAQAVTLHFDPPLVTGVTSWIRDNAHLDPEQTAMVWGVGALVHGVLLVTRRKNWALFMLGCLPALSYFMATFYWALGVSGWQAFNMSWFAYGLVLLFVLRFSVED